MFSELAGLAIGNLFRARARLAMTAGGVVVGTSAVILLVALTFGLQRSAEAGIGNSSAVTEIQVYPSWEIPPGQSPEDMPQLNLETVQELWRIPGVAAVIPMVNLQVGGDLMSGDYIAGANIVGIDSRLLPYLGITLEQGTLSLQPGEMIVGPYIGENFFDPTSEFYEPVQVDVYNTPLKFRVTNWNNGTELKKDIKVSGTFAAGTSFDYTIFMNVNDIIGYNEWASGQETDPETFTFGQVLVRANSRETTIDVTNAIKDLGLNAYSMGEFLGQMNNFFRTMRLILGGVGGVALLVAAFGVANTMTMAILERTKEIGLMKAIGATDRDVLTVFLIESGLVGLAGGVVGVILSFILRRVINQAVANAPTGEDSVTNFLPFNTSQIGGNLIIIPTDLWLFAIVLATLVGLGAGLFPSLRAARLSPVIALKQE